jgi:transketolase
MDKVQQLNNICHEMKLKALDMALGTGNNGAHIGGGFSAMEIFATLYSVANVSDMSNEARDRIIVSKGHCVLAYYTALWKYGFISESELQDFDKNGTGLYGHPHRNLNRGIEFSGGSLGLGLSYAVGVAIACKKKDISNKIYVIVGDGECDEGIVWESLMSIANFNLDNIVIIVDRNKYQLDGPTSEVMNQFSLEKKFNSFGFDVETINGHSVTELYKSISRDCNKYRVIIADTVKANGISFLENNKISHQCALSPKKYNIAVEEINNEYNGNQI